MNYNYSTSYTSTDLAAAGLTAGVSAGVMVVYSIITIAIAVLGIIAMWKIFTVRIIFSQIEKILCLRFQFRFFTRMPCLMDIYRLTAPSRLTIPLW